MDYLNIYEQKTGIKIPKGNHIHHIDHNRSNNEINNLVSIPKQLHIKYHRVKHHYDVAINELNSYIYFYPKDFNKYTEVIRKLMEVKNEIGLYISNRDNQIYLNK